MFPTYSPLREAVELSTFPPSPGTAEFFFGRGLRETARCILFWTQANLNFNSFPKK